MRLVLQRVDEAWVEVGEQLVGAIDRGLLVLAGVEKRDTERDARRAADKVAGLRVFADDAGRMNRSLADVDGAVLAVSQFTLVGSIDRGRRPGFDGAMEPAAAEPLFECFVDSLRAKGLPVETGVFGADMRVHLVNDGPVTFIYDTRRGVESGA